MIDFEPEEPAPTALLQCPACGQDIAFYGDDDAEHGETYTLAVAERAVCPCGEVYTEGATLTVIPEHDYDNLETWE